ncbi:MAG: TonB-dependent receptor plug domain-containing protein, partial [Bacteroidales bacterium]
FAGVSGGDDNSNEIIIRGNSPNWMVWRLEGVEIPTPNHFVEEGYSSGKVSMLSSNMVGKSDFYTGAFPAEYGNALSGVFDIKLRKGNNEKKEFTVQAGVLGIDLSAEGPFSKNYDGSFLFNYRYSTFSLMNRLNLEITENTLPNYQDLSYKIHLPTKKAGTFSLWGLGGVSDVNEEFIPDTTIGEKLNYGYRVFIETGMYTTGLTHTLFPDDKSYIKTVLSHSMSYSSQTVDQMNILGYFEDDFYDDLQKKALRINSYYNRKISKRLTMRTGITMNNIRYNYYAREINDADSWSDLLNSEGSTNIFNAYFQGKYNFSERILFTAGMHYNHFQLSRDNSIEPRMALSFEIDDKRTFSLGYGRHSKNENLPVYFVEKISESGEVYRPNKDLKMIRSDHYIASYEQKIGKNMMLKLETYYQNISQLPVPVNPEKKYAPFLGGVPKYDTLANIGEGKNVGVEFTFQKFFTHDYYFLITSSLFDSKFRPADGNWYNSRYNINYVNNLVAGKEFDWSDNKMISFNTKVIWSGGKRLRTIDLEASREAEEAVYIEDDIYSTRAKDYFRIDLGIRLHFYGEKVEQVLSLDVQNVTNRQNTWFKDYDPVKDRIYDYPMAGMIPVINYRVEF